MSSQVASSDIQQAEGQAWSPHFRVYLFLFFIDRSGDKRHFDLKICWLGMHVDDSLAQSTKLISPNEATGTRQMEQYRVCPHVVYSYKSEPQNFLHSVVLDGETFATALQFTKGLT